MRKWYLELAGCLGGAREWETATTERIDCRDQAGKALGGPRSAPNLGIVFGWFEARWSLAPPRDSLKAERLINLSTWTHVDLQSALTAGPIDARSEPRGVSQMAIRNKSVTAGDWRTLETFWNVTTTAFFQAPAGAEIKIRYSGGWVGVDRQQQTLDGVSIKRLVVSPWSVFTARIQIRVKQSTSVAYDVEPGDVAVMPPRVEF